MTKKHRLLSAAAVVGMVVLGTVLPATAAQADSLCLNGKKEYPTETTFRLTCYTDNMTLVYAATNCYSAVNGNYVTWRKSTHAFMVGQATTNPCPSGTYAANGWAKKA
ncbi:hypothetical protein AB0M43_06275 [Longispora sp. NPDC051575]|uniref:hypothetical protein n=1 Tax=Longispora sp. NPDC051575 TaxID=3154943 RepID=UPI003428282F